MISVILEHGETPLSVFLTLKDLSVYCSACSRIKQTATTLAETENIPLSDAIGRVASHDESYQTERTALLKEFSGLSGSLHWRNIKSMLAAQCARLDPTGGLSQRVSFTANMLWQGEPLAVESLNNSFIELFKNAVDAVVNRYLSGIDDKTVLTMKVALDITEDNISVIVADDAGGFSLNNLINFEDSIKSGTYKHAKQKSEKTKDSQFYFGGARLGLQWLTIFVLDGEVREESKDAQESTRKQYSIPQGATSIRIGNNPSMGGAEIILTSPLVPFPPCIVRPSLVAGTSFFGSASLLKKRAEAKQHQARLSQESIDSAVSRNRSSSMESFSSLASSEIDLVAK